MKKLTLILTLFFAFTLAANAQEGTVCISQDAANKAAQCFDENKALRELVTRYEAKDKLSEQQITLLKELVELQRAETKELRAAVQELIKSSRRRGWSLCLMGCFIR